MKLAVVVLMLLSCAAAEDAAYRDAVLLSFRDVASGASCSGSVRAHSGSSGDVTGQTDTDCSQNYQRQYSIQMGKQIFVLVFTGSAKARAAAAATLGFSSMFSKSSALRDQLPGAHLLIRSDSSGVYVKVGKRESRYRIVEAAASTTASTSP